MKQIALHTVIITYALFATFSVSGQAHGGFLIGLPILFSYIGLGLIVIIAKLQDFIQSI